MDNNIFKNSGEAFDLLVFYFIWGNVLDALINHNLVKHLT